MTNKEVLKLALEALKTADWYIDQLEMIVYSADDLETHHERAKVQAVIKALEEALANHCEDNLDMVKQEHPIERNFCERCGKRAFDGIHTCTPPAKQEQGEPVAEIKRNSSGQIYIDWRDGESAIVNLVDAKLYTTPQQRTWVGLDEEDDIDWEEGGSLRDLVEAVEAKLKEKNT